MNKIKKWFIYFSYPVFYYSLVYLMWSRGEDVEFLILFGIVCFALWIFTAGFLTMDIKKEGEKDDGTN